MNRYGGCFAQHSLVKLADGTHSEIQFLRPGARVWGGASVVHVVRINYDAVVPMVAMQGDVGEGVLRQRFSHLNVTNNRVCDSAETAPVLVTPWHPVCIDGTWTFPCRVATPSPLYMRCVYNVVLSSGHVVCINGLPFITLGHGSTDPVLAHAFFGTQVLLRTRACGAEQFH